MNYEATEMTVERAEKVEESLDVLALSFDDLDLVGGGTVVATGL
jgi:hypothetical protein